MSENNNLELYRRYRPKLFKDLIGQDAAVKQLSDWLKRKEFPHALMRAVS